MVQSSAHEVEIQDVRLPIFLSFLDYLYTGHVAAEQDQSMELYAVADRVRTTVSNCLS